MNEQRDALTTIASHPVASPPAEAGRTVLRVGTCDLEAKDGILLQSLVRLLSGHEGLCVQHCDSPSDCDVLFVPASWPRRVGNHCLTVQLLEPNAPDLPSSDAGLFMRRPMRASNTASVLQAATAQFARRRRGGAAAGALATLFETMTGLLMARERRFTVLELSEGRTLGLDFAHGLVRTDLDADGLCQITLSLMSTRRGDAGDMQTMATWPAMRMRDLVWRWSQRLALQADGVIVPRGRYRLLRWPDASALSLPGVPRLSALLTQQPMSVQEAAGTSGLSVPSVVRFLDAALALGIAAPDADAGPATVDPVERRPDPGVARGLLRRLREQLKLW